MLFANGWVSVGPSVEVEVEVIGESHRRGGITQAFDIDHHHWVQISCTGNLDISGICFRSASVSPTAYS